MGANLGEAGRPGGNRTPNLRFWRPLLCQLSYWPVSDARNPLQAACTTAGAMIAKVSPGGNPFRQYRAGKEKGEPWLAFLCLELMDGFEPSTSPLPRVCSTPELHEQNSLAHPACLYHSSLAILERAAGIEPASSAWKAEVLPLNYARPPTLAAESPKSITA